LVISAPLRLLATARAGSRPNSQGAVCLNNLKQLMTTFTMYTHDNSEFFPPNPDTITHVKGANWVPDNESGWMPFGSTGGTTDAGNPDLLTDPKWNPFAAFP
jgi:hypothetical protein